MGAVIASTRFLSSIFALSLSLEFFEDRVQLMNSLYCPQLTSVLATHIGSTTDFDLRPFVVIAICFVFGTSHFEGAARDRNHVEVTSVPGIVDLCREP